MSRIRTVLAAAILAAALFAPAAAMAGPPDDSGPDNSTLSWTWKG